MKTPFGFRTFLVATCMTIVAMDLGAGIPLAVKRGQATVDPKSLPFLCFALVIDGPPSPIEKIVFRDVETKRTYTAQLGKTFNPDEPDYLVALDGQRRLAGLIILKMRAGTYELASVELTPGRGGGTRSLIFEFPPALLYRFTMRPSAVNYLGSLVLTIPVSSMVVPRPNMYSGYSSSSFSYTLAVENTQERDAKWATDLIPAVVGLPAVNGSFATQTQSAEATSAKRDEQK